ncbi:MAG: Plug domain-containing protein [Opitutaceae bacterium]
MNAAQAQGYFTPNTTTGTRLANNIGDIPSAVTVIDKQQIENTNAQNINDIMMYEAGTEGSHTYTPYTGFTESTRVDDALAGSNDNSASIGGLNTASTRVNGLGVPDNEVDDFYGLYRIPFDTYNVQSIEIDRGPNSLMFGSGSAAGIVNASSSEAQLDKLTGDVSFQGSSFGGFRQTADLNIPLIRNKVALYLAEEYNSVGFQRQPSSDLTRRQYATITIDPFKSHKTKITAYAEFYNNYANDENSLLPEDLITPWLAAGKPEMNPVTGMVTDLATGKVLGPYVSSTTSPNYVAGEVTGSGGLTSITPAAADDRIQLRRLNRGPSADLAADRLPGAGSVGVHDRVRPAADSRSRDSRHSGDHCQRRGKRRILELLSARNRQSGPLQCADRPEL